MNRTALAALPIVAALALAGCSTAATHQPEQVGAQATYQTPADPQMEQAIAEAALNRWLSNEGAHSLEGFSAPYNLITSVAGPERGTIVLTVDNALADRDVPEADLHKIAAEMLDSIGDTFTEISRITAHTKDGALSATAYRAQPGTLTT